MNTSRRTFLQTTAAAALGASTPWLPAAEVPARLRVRAYDIVGRPLPASAFDGFFLIEAAGDRNPIPNPPRDTAAGLLQTDAPPGRFGFSFMSAVDGFGAVRLYADNDGKGYEPGQELVLNRELASSRLTVVEAYVATTRQAGFDIPPGVTGRLEKARALLKEADAASGDPARLAPPAMASLTESVWAGEEAVLAQARQAISRRGPRPGFLFGCNFFGYPALGETYASKFAALFNFATLPFYWASFEAEKGKPGFERVDRMLERLDRSGITGKGHPLSWFHEAGCPQWMLGKPFEEWQSECRRRITDIVTRYKGRIKVYDVINEAHDWGNVPQFTQDQLLEMTRLAADTTHQADPQATRVINNCCLFAEYVATGRTYRGPQGRTLRSPLQYLRAVLKAGVDFDAVGLQVYYPEHDLFEIARMLDCFAALGKPLHVTELGVSSDVSRDDRGYVKSPTANFWHAPWSETIQADWVEQFYTLCYAHPAIRAVTWWDFADAGHFWPHGGFLRSNLEPKQSYQRLLALTQRWRGN